VTSENGSQSTLRGFKFSKLSYLGCQMQERFSRGLSSSQDVGAFLGSRSSGTQNPVEAFGDPAVLSETL